MSVGCITCLEVGQGGGGGFFDGLCDADARQGGALDVGPALERRGQVKPLLRRDGREPTLREVAHLRKVAQRGTA